MELNESAKAKDHFERTLNLDPKHAGALRSLGIVLLQENKPSEALPYLKRAIEAEPTSWRAHALLAEAALQVGSVDESVLQARRALELGHSQAATVQPLLARALTKHGDAADAIQVLQAYLQSHPSDRAAIKQLENLKIGSQPGAAVEAQLSILELPPADPQALVAATPFVPSSWLPPDIDEKIPPVEPGAACPLDEVVRNTGERVREFVKNVDRFTATETITHETINRWGLTSSAMKFKFNYLVSIGETRPGFLDVEEFRSSTYSADGFPDGILDRGLATQLLVFGWSAGVPIPRY